MKAQSRTDWAFFRFPRSHPTAFNYFCNMKWIGEQISFHEEGNISSFVIFPRKKTWLISLMGAWSAMWLTIGITMIWAYFALSLTQTEKIIVVVFLSFWLFYAYQILRAFTWMMGGKEMLRFTPERMIYKRSYYGYGKAHPIFYENIDKITLHLPSEKSIQQAWENAPWTVGGERLEFKQIGKTFKLGRKLNEKDAQTLYQMITKRVEQAQRRAKKNG